MRRLRRVWEPEVPRRERDYVDFLLDLTRIILFLVAALIVIDFLKDFGIIPDPPELGATLGDFIGALLTFALYMAEKVIREMSGRFSKLEERMARMEERYGSLDLAYRVGALEESHRQLRETLTRIEEKLSKLTSSA